MVGDTPKTAENARIVEMLQTHAFLRRDRNDRICRSADLRRVLTGPPHGVPGWRGPTMALVSAAQVVWVPGDVGGW